MPPDRFNEHGNYVVEVRQLIEDSEQIIRLSKTACAIAKDLQAEAKRLQVALQLEYHKRALRR
jgi:hypothetical protein